MSNRTRNILFFIGAIVAISLANVWFDALDFSNQLVLVGVAIILFTNWFITSNLKPHVTSEVSDLKQDLLRELKDHVDSRVDALEEKFSDLIDPIESEVSELAMMYKEDNPRHDDIL